MLEADDIAVSLPTGFEFAYQTRPNDSIAHHATKCSARSPAARGWCYDRSVRLGSVRMNPWAKIRNDSKSYRFDASYEEVVVVEDELRVRIRPIRSSDKPALARGFEQLTAASRYDRFMGHKTELTEEDLKYFTEVDGIDHVALAALLVIDGDVEEPIGTARFVRLRDDEGVAEAAVTIIDAYQGRGVGTLLLERLLGAAWERDIRWFHFELWSRNVGMKHLIETVSHEEVDYIHHGSGCLTAQFPVPEPDRHSLVPKIEKDSPFRRVLRNLARERIVARPRSTRPPPPPE